MAVGAEDRLKDLPEDWSVVRLGDVCRIFGRIGFRGYTKADIVDEGSGALAISPSNIKNDRLVFNKCTYISWAKYEESPEIQIENGDILLVKTGSTFGKTALVQKLPEKATLNPQVVVLKNSRVSEAYLAYVMAFDTIQDQISSTIVGGALPTLSQRVIADFAVPIPTTLTEQEAIADALSDADALIESLECLIAKKRDIKQGAMQELLTGKRRLPGFSGEWEEITLGQLGRCHRGVSYDPDTDLFESDRDSTIRLLRANNVQEQRIELSRMQFVAAHRVSGVQRLRNDDVIVCTANGSRRLVGKAARFSVEDGHHYTFGAFMGCFRPNREAVDSSFASYLFQTGGYRAQIDVLLAGSSINNLRPVDLESLSVSVPLQRSEQEAIATTLSDVDAEIDALEKKRTKARQTKQGMTHELLTGRIRLV